MTLREKGKKGKRREREERGEERRKKKKEPRKKMVESAFSWSGFHNCGWVEKGGFVIFDLLSNVMEMLEGA